jgi:hypothetical protein
MKVLPRTKKSNSPQKKVIVKELVCTICGETKKASEYYQSFNPIHKTSKLPYCKTCLKNMCLDNSGNIDIERLKKMLQLIDRPFLYDIVKISFEDKMDTVGCIIKNLAMPQYRYLGWKDSIFDPTCDNDNKISNSEDININSSDLKKLQEKYGYGFEAEEYLNFERKYKKLSRGYKEKTELHTERLITYIIHKVKEEMSTARGQVQESEKWAKLAQADATAAKLNVSQLSKSDITGGIDLVPQLVEAIEQYASLIPLLPKVLEQPYDDADLIIWANINYLRHLEDKPFIPYKDIWNFYDKMLEEFYKQKGYSDEQIQEEKKKRNNVFRDLGEVYIEPLYEHPDDFVDDSGDSDEFV